MLGRMRAAPAGAASLLLVALLAPIAIVPLALPTEASHTIFLVSPADEAAIYATGTVTFTWGTTTAHSGNVYARAFIEGIDNSGTSIIRSCQNWYGAGTTDFSCTLTGLPWGSYCWGAGYEYEQDYVPGPNTPQPGPSGAGTGYCSSDFLLESSPPVQQPTPATIDYPTATVYNSPGPDYHAVTIYWHDACNNPQVCTGYRVNTDPNSSSKDCQNIPYSASHTYSCTILAKGGMAHTVSITTNERVQSQVHTYTLSAAPPPDPPNPNYPTNYGDLNVRRWSFACGPTPGNIIFSWSGWDIGPININNYQTGQIINPTWTRYSDYTARDYVGWPAENGTYVLSGNAVDTDLMFRLVFLGMHTPGQSYGTGNFHITCGKVTVPSITAEGGFNSVILHWNAPATDSGPIQTYTIYRQTPTGWQQVGQVNGLTQTFVDPTAKARTTYTYRITATNPHGEGSPSSTATATAYGVPDAPDVTVNQGSTPGAIDVSWTPNENGGRPITAYKVYRSENAEGPWTYLGQRKSYNYTDSNLQPDFTYYYRVEAVNIGGASPPGGPAWADTMGVPTEPRDLEIIPGSHEMRINWTAPSNDRGSAVTQYKISAKHGTGPYSVLGTTSGTTYLHTGLGHDDAWTYRVQATNAVGNSQFSAEGSGKTFGLPEAPQHLVGNPSGTSIAVTWEPPAYDGGYAITSYSLYRGPSSTSLSLVGTFTSPTYTDTGLTPGQVVWYQVSATNHAGEGPRTPPTPATAADRPGPPRNLQRNVTGNDANLTWLRPAWDGGSPVTHYNYYHSTDGISYTLMGNVSAKSVHADNAPVLGTPCTLSCSGLTRPYTFKVTAVNAIGEGPPAYEGPITFEPESIRGTTPGSGGPLQQAYPCPNEPTSSVNLVSGQFVGSMCLLFAESKYADLDVALTLTHRSQSNEAGFAGANWFLSVERRIEAEGDQAILVDGTGRRDVFARDSATSPWQSPPGYYERLATTATGFELEHVGGTKEIFNDEGQRTEVRDVVGNRVQFRYDTYGHLVEVTDAHDRTIALAYEGTRLTAIRDFAGRTVTLEFDGDDLASVTAPGNQTGAAAAYSFTYEDHDLKSASVDGWRFLNNTYNANKRVETQFYGPPLPAGLVGPPFMGSFKFTYNPAQQSTTAQDRNGNVVDWAYVSQVRPVPTQKSVQSNRVAQSTQDATLATTYEFNANLELTRITEAGRTTAFDYDDSNANPIARGNLLSASAGNPPLETTYTYESAYQSLKTVTDPLGHATYFYYGQDEPALDITFPGRGDLNSDGSLGTGSSPPGRVVLIYHPKVNAAGVRDPNLDPASGNLERIEFFQYNLRGQVKMHLDSDALTNYTYYDSNGAGGTKGFVRDTIQYEDGWTIDAPTFLPASYAYSHARTDPVFRPAGNALVNHYTYNAQGNVATHTDPSGNTTRYEYDNFGHVTRQALDGNVPREVKYDYDARGNLVAKRTLNAVAQSDGSYVIDSARPYLVDRFTYDVLGQKTGEWLDATRPSGSPASTQPTTIRQSFEYDRNGNLVLMRRHDATTGTNPNAVTTYLYNERDQLVATTTGGKNPLLELLPGNAAVDASSVTDPFTLYLRAETPLDLPVGPSQLGTPQTGTIDIKDVPISISEACMDADDDGSATTVTVGVEGSSIQVTQAVPITGTGDQQACTSDALGGVPETCMGVEDDGTATTVTVGVEGTIIQTNQTVPVTGTGDQYACTSETIPGVWTPITPPHVYYGFSMDPNAPGENSTRKSAPAVTLVDGQPTVNEARLAWSWTGSYGFTNVRIQVVFLAEQLDDATSETNVWKARLYSNDALVASNGDGTSFRPMPAGEVQEYRISLGTTSFGGNNLRLELEAAPAPNGRIVYFDARSALSRLEIGNAVTTTTEYNPDGTPAATVDANGVKTYRAYDAYGRVVETGNDQGTRTTFEYDANGQATKQESFGALGGLGYQATPGGIVLLERRLRQYDEAGQLFREDAALFDPATGNPLPDGGIHPGDGYATTLYAYDQQGRLFQRVDDNGGSHTFLYNGVGRLKRETDPAGNLLNYTYDANGHLVKATRYESAPSGPGRTYTVWHSYDEAGNRIRTVDSLGSAYRHGYDLEGRIIWQTDAKGPLMADPSGAYGGLVNQHGNRVNYTYDAQGRLIQVKRELRTGGTANGTYLGAVTTTQEWDADGRLASQTDDRGGKTKYAYDNAGRLVKETYADNKQREFFLDANGNVVRTAEPNGNTIYRDFDGAGNHVRTTVTGPATRSLLQTYEYDGLGRLTRATDNNDPAWTGDDSVVIRAYDSLGRATSETQNGRTVARAYDGVGNAISLSYPNGRVLSRSYDDAGRLTGVRQGAATLATFTYGSGPLLSEGRGNGVSTSYTYDANSRLSSVATLVNGGTAIRFDYAYGRNGERASEAKTHAPTLSQRHTYDSLGRLVGLTRGNHADLEEPTTPLPAATMASNSSWSLDGANNWPTYASTKGAVTTSQVNSYGSTNNLAASTVGAATTTYTYDLNGNTLQDANYAYTWDAFGRLRRVEITGTIVAEYNYDALDRRIEKILYLPTRITQYAYDGVNAIEERGGSPLLRQFVFGDAPDQVVAMDRNLNGDATATGAGDQRLYYVRDALGSTTALLDAEGNAKEGYLYEAYGKTIVVKPGANGVLEWGGDDTTAATSALDNPIAYTGQRLDAETGRYFYKARYFDAANGRFLSRDPIGVWTDGMNLGNPYAYVGSRPFGLRDPSGNCGWEPGDEAPPWQPDFFGCAKEVVDYGVASVRGVADSCKSTGMPGDPGWPYANDCAKNLGSNLLNGLKSDLDWLSCIFGYKLPQVPFADPCRNDPCHGLSQKQAADCHVLHAINVALVFTGVPRGLRVGTTLERSPTFMVHGAETAGRGAGKAGFGGGSVDFLLKANGRTYRMPGHAQVRLAERATIEEVERALAYPGKDALYNGVTRTYHYDPINRLMVSTEGDTIVTVMNNYSPSRASRLVGGSPS